MVGCDIVAVTALLWWTCEHGGAGGVVEAWEGDDGLVSEWSELAAVEGESTTELLVAVVAGRDVGELSLIHI